MNNVPIKLQNQRCNGYVPTEDSIMPCIDPRGILSDWLSDTGPYEYKMNGYHYTLIRVRKNADFDYLYTQQRYYNSNSDKNFGIERREKFEYAGIYCRRDGLVYDGSNALESLFDDPEARTMHKANNLRNQLKFAVCKTVEAAIGNDRNNLRITEVSTKQEIEKLERYRSYGVVGEARKAYLSSDDDSESLVLTFQCDYQPEQWTEDSLLAYILDPNSYVRAEVKAYIDSHQEHMLSNFFANDMFMAAYKKIVDNPSNPVHYVKRIMRAMSVSSAKTITVTIRKADTEFTFKTEAREFRSDCTSSYGNWNIVAADRKEFERIFGRDHYRPEDIIRIEYLSAMQAASSLRCFIPRSVGASGNMATPFSSRVTPFTSINALLAAVST